MRVSYEAFLESLNASIVCSDFKFFYEQKSTGELIVELPVFLACVRTKHMDDVIYI